MAPEMRPPRSLTDLSGTRRQWTLRRIPLPVPGLVELGEKPRVQYDVEALLRFSPSAGFVPDRKFCWLTRPCFVVSEPDWGVTGGLLANARAVCSFASRAVRGVFPRPVWRRRFPRIIRFGWTIAHYAASADEYSLECGSQELVWLEY